MRALVYRELSERKGIPHSREWIRQLEQQGLFPKRIKISAGRVGWLEHEIDAWLKSKADAREAA